MTSIDFAEAQQRVANRRLTRSKERRLHADAVASSSTLTSPSTSLNGLTIHGWQLWETISGRTGTNANFRVGQVDAELLDEELLDLLGGQVGEAFKYFGSHIRDDWSAEILMGLRAILFKLSIWDHNASYGATLQDLRYTDARRPGPLSSVPTSWQKVCYGLVTVGGSYGWTKWEEWLSGQEGDYEQPRRKIRILSRISSLAMTTHSIAAFISFAVFLANGRYRTLLDRILRMRLVPPANQARREVSFEYLNRQLVWHAFTEFLLFLLPLVGISRWRKWIARAWRKAQALTKSGADEEDEDFPPSGELSFLPERTCAICYQDQTSTSTSTGQIQGVPAASGGIVGSAQTDVTNPYEATCGCIYCFVCIATRIDAEQGEAWICLRCGRGAKDCRPWAGDVVDQSVPDKMFPDTASDEHQVLGKIKEDTGISPTPHESLRSS